jgi:TfoX/Sxy family transcriptional regulator of competence genes
MKYYSEETGKLLRLGFEEKVLRWPQVSTKKMFGCPSYQANGKLFAFLVTNGVVITQLGQADRERIGRQCQSSIFKGGKRVVQNWLRLPIEHTRDLGRIMPFVRRSYESALRKA